MKQNLVNGMRKVAPYPAVTRLHAIGWVALVVAHMAIAILSDWPILSKPDNAIVLSQATYLPETGGAIEVSLPHAIYPQISQTPNIVRYVIGFDLAAAPGESQFLYIPSFNRRISVVINGETLFTGDYSASWTGPLTGTSIMVRLPRLVMVAGHNQLTVVVETGPYVIPSYLSQIYLGTEDALVSPFKLRSFFASQLKTMALAAHALLGLGLIFAYFSRPEDPLFAWLAAFNVISLIVATGLFVGWHQPLQPFLPFVVILNPAAALLFFGVALLIVNVRPPRAFGLIIIAVTLLLLPCAVVNTTLAKLIAIGCAAASWIVATVAGAAVIAWSAFRSRNADARLMLGPYFLFSWYAIRDVFVTATLPQHGFDLLVPYQRPLFLAFIMAVLMRRMGANLSQLDRSNEMLNTKLAERESELAAFHRLERVKAVNTVREQERQRLTHDLHDGLSGHLASIIALSERSNDKSIEQAAREALNDLRLVIYSLDLNDTELPLAMANFRERLIPQLHRLGVELDWSTAGMPEVTGVTPGNALAVLRILQEAITNALKHGPARKIIIRAALTTEGKVAITVENDGNTFAESGSGHGLTNMRRRADQLQGQTKIESMKEGVKFTLLLPQCLPDFKEDAVA